MNNERDVKSDVKSDSNADHSHPQTRLCPVAVFLSGRGSNFAALARYVQERTQEGKISFRINHVFTDNPNAGGLTTASDLGIPYTVLERKAFSSKTELFQAYQEAIWASGCELIVLAGFMRLLPSEFTDAFVGKIINIHPALLPKFPGLHTHQRALAEGVIEHGCTVHFVDGGMDTGPNIAQAAVTVLQEDTEETLAAKVLAQEHQILPWVIDQIASGRIWLEAARVGYAVRGSCTYEVRYGPGVKDEIADHGWRVPSAVLTAEK